MHRAKAFVCSSKPFVSLLLLTPGLCFAVPPSAAGTTGSTCLAWTGSQPPSPGTSVSILSAVSTLSSCSAWAVGHDSGGSSTSTLTERWNGVGWAAVPSPNPSPLYNWLYGVTELSTTDAWAVGASSNGAADQTLIEHWNGSSWKVVPSPDPGGATNSNDLYSVAAASAKDVWAVGAHYISRSVVETLIEHWNGSVWSDVKSPDPAGSASENELEAVAVTSSSNAWAVGDYYKGAAHETLIAHWNGSVWAAVKSKSPSSQSFLDGISATSAKNAWAVGNSTSGGVNKTLIEHWNGVAWSDVPSPDRGTSDNDLLGVASSSASSAFAVGEYHSGATFRTLVEHWNGAAWAIVASPNPGSGTNAVFAGVSAGSPTNVWSVGDDNVGRVIEAAAFHCC
jgi:hypothetical protein